MSNQNFPNVFYRTYNRHYKVECLNCDVFCRQLICSWHRLTKRNAIIKQCQTVVHEFILKSNQTITKNILIIKRDLLCIIKNLAFLLLFLFFVLKQSSSRPSLIHVSKADAGHLIKHVINILINNLYHLEWIFL